MDEKIKDFIVDLYKGGPYLRDKMPEKYESLIEPCLNEGLIEIRKEALGDLIFLSYKGLQEALKILGETVEVDVDRELSNLTKTEAKILVNLLGGFKPIRRLLEEIGTRKYTALYRLEEKRLVKTYKDTQRARNYRV